MGGLRRELPITHVTFLIGTLALVAIPPFAGFWSKDAILASALASRRGARLGALHRRPARDVPHRSLRAAALLLRLPRRAETRGARGRGPRRGAVLDDRARARARSRLDGRRVPRDPRRLGAVRGLARTGRRAARHPVVDRGLADEPRRGVLRDGRRVPRLARVPGRARARHGRRRPPGARAQALLRRALRRALHASCAGARGAAPDDVEEPVVQGSLDEIGGGTLEVSADVGRARPACCARTRSPSRSRSPSSPSSSSWCDVPRLAMSSRSWRADADDAPHRAPDRRWRCWSGRLPLVARVDRSARRPRRARRGRPLDRRPRGFDFSSQELQYSAPREWFGDLGISYSVGFYGFSALARGPDGGRRAPRRSATAMWVGRDRSRAYYGLMLFLVGARRRRRSSRRTSSSSTSSSRRC